MDDATYKTWDLRLKIIAPILTIAGLLIGVWQFTKGQSAQLERQYQLSAESDRMEFKRRVWEKQQEAYMKISSVVGRIASGNQSKEELMKDIIAFDSLYWGEMIYVEDKTVEQAMIDFHVEIQDFLNNIGTKDRLKLRAEALIQACRNSSRASWFSAQ
jgi:hypothetical protein